MTGAVPSSSSEPIVSTPASRRSATMAWFASSSAGRVCSGKPHSDSEGIATSCARSSFNRGMRDATACGDRREDIGGSSWGGPSEGGGVDGCDDHRPPRSPPQLRPVGVSAGLRISQGVERTGWKDRSHTADTHKEGNMRRSAALALLATVAAALALVSGAYADPNNNNSAKLRAAVTLDGVRAHQLALQQIANANGGTRFAGLPGHDASVAYVVDTLKAAGYDPVVQPFDYLAFAEVGPSALQQTAPGQGTYVEGVDFGAIDQTDPGDVTAPVTAVDLQLGVGNTSTSGCEMSDFGTFPAGNIALLQRGTCTFELKAENAAAAGAVGIVIFNQGN